MKELPTHILFELTKVNPEEYLDYLAMSFEALAELDQRGIEWQEGQENWLLDFIETDA